MVAGLCKIVSDAAPGAVCCSVMYSGDSFSVYLLRWQCHLCLLASGADQTRPSAKEKHNNNNSSDMSINKTNHSNYYNQSLKQTFSDSQREWTR